MEVIILLPAGSDPFLLMVLFEHTLILGYIKGI